MALAAGGQFAFVIETKSEYSRDWYSVTDSAGDGGIALGAGVQDVAEGTARDFADTLLDRYIAYLASVPEYAERYLREEEIDIRVHVWDLSEIPYDPGSVPEPDSYPAHFYWAALKHAGIEPSTTVTWSALEVWRHLNSAIEANQATAKQPATQATVEASPSRDPMGRGDEESVTAAFRRWLTAHGWTIDPPDRAGPDVTAVCGRQRLIGEAKSDTGANAGTDLDTAYGQLLRRMTNPGPDTRYALIVPATILRSAQRVPAHIRQTLRIELYVVDNDGQVHLIEH